MCAQATPMAPPGRPRATNRANGRPPRETLPRRVACGSAGWITGRIIARRRRVSSATAMDPYERLKEATRWMWGLGDYSALGSLLEPLNAADDGRLVLESDYLQVVARRGSP